MMGEPVDEREEEKREKESQRDPGHPRNPRGELYIFRLPPPSICTTWTICTTMIMDDDMTKQQKHHTITQTNWHAYLLPSPSLPAAAGSKEGEKREKSMIMRMEASILAAKASGTEVVKLPHDVHHHQSNQASKQSIHHGHHGAAGGDLVTLLRLASNVRYLRARNLSNPSNQGPQIQLSTQPIRVRT
jgi:hypothetical protein